MRPAGASRSSPARCASSRRTPGQPPSRSTRSSTEIKEMMRRDDRGRQQRRATRSSRPSRHVRGRSTSGVAGRGQPSLAPYASPVMAGERRQPRRRPWPTVRRMATRTPGATAMHRRPRTCSVLIVGGGPAGYTAAIYAARAGLAPVCIEGYDSGGQIVPLRPRRQLPRATRRHLRRRTRRAGSASRPSVFGARLVTADVQSVELSRLAVRVVTTDAKRYLADTVIVATGARSRRLGLASEDAFEGAASATARSATARSSPAGGSPSSAAATPRWRRPWR